MDGCRDRNKRRWLNNGQVVVLAKANGEHALVEVLRLIGEDDGLHAIYQVAECNAGRATYPASDKHLDARGSPAPRKI